MSLLHIEDFSDEEFNKFFNSFDTVLTDCDGVLWVDNEPLPGSVEVMNRLKDMGKNVFFITNNSTRTRDEFVTKFRKLGFNVEKKEIVSTAYLTALYLSEIGFKKKAYIIGTKGISQELDQVGIKHFGVGPDVLESDMGTLVRGVQLEQDVGAVIVGFDEHFSVPKALKAASYLNNPDCLFIATNTDERFPFSSQLIVPGTGTFVNAISTCAERLPFIIGKPAKYICDAIVKGNGLDPARSLMIGDKCNTDILFGRKCGFQTLLVLSGVTSFPQVFEWKQSKNESRAEWIPDMYAENLGRLLGRMK